MINSADLYKDLISIIRSFTKTNTMIFNLATVLFCFVSVLYALPTDDEDDVSWILKKLDKTAPEVFTGYESASSAVRDFQESAGITETGELSSETIATMNIGDAESEGTTKGELSSETIATTNIPQFTEKSKIGDAESDSEETTEEPIDAPDICEDASLDTITRTSDGSTYAFKGDFYWKINYNVTADGYPRKIEEDWGGLEGDLDASFTGLGSKTFFFKDERYWSFTNKRMDSGYPKLISERFKGIPADLDAAITWGGNGKPYFFKGGQYWRYDAGENPPVKDAYPASITEWKGLPLDGVDAAVLWDNYASYFFKGRYYYRFDDVASQVSRQYKYPASTAIEWFSCEYRHKYCTYV